MAIKITKRDVYSVKTLLNDLKKLKLTPNSLYLIGSEIVYYEWMQAKEILGEDDEITALLAELMTFMEEEYESRLVEGDIRREDDTLSHTFTEYLKETPIEFQGYTLARSGDFIRGVLMAAKTQSERDIIRYQRIETSIRKKLEGKPNDSELWNELRIALWIQGKYEDATGAYKKAKKLGWNKSKSKTIGV